MNNSFWVLTTSFVPWNDDYNANPQNLSEATSSNPPMNTLRIDQYRQGVEIRNSKDYFSATPRFFAGKLTPSGTISLPSQNIFGIGQLTGYSEFFSKTQFRDRAKFNPVAYILTSSTNPETFPFFLSKGPQALQVAIIEPFPIKIKDNIEGLPSFRGVHGSFDQGNKNYKGGNDQISQFIQRTSSSVIPYNDTGITIYGENPSNGIQHPGYITYASRSVQPFSDTSCFQDIKTTSRISGSIGNAMSELSGYRNEGLLPRGNKSSAAGPSAVYGPKQGYYGTDSIAFVGLIRGS